MHLGLGEALKPLNAKQGTTYACTCRKYTVIVGDVLGFWSEMVSPLVAVRLWSLHWEMFWLVWVSLVAGINLHLLDPVGRRR